MSAELKPNAPETKPKRRWFRFSLRMLLVVVTVLCVWLGFKVNAARRQKEAVELILKAGGTITYDYQWVSSPNGQKVFDAKALPPGPNWLHELIGDEFFRNAASVFLQDGVIDESDFSHLSGLDTLTEILLCNVRIVSRNTGLRRPIQDSDLGTLGQLTQLRSVDLGNVEIKGFGLASFMHLKELRNFRLGFNHAYQPAAPALEQIGKITTLQTLYLNGFHIDNDELLQLRNLTNLKILSLADTDISDAGLPYLTGFTKLTHLFLHRDPVTANKVRELQKSLPNTRIESPWYLN
jgi:hypothetical protein